MGKAKILLVEDSKTQAGQAKGVLEKNGYEVSWVEDGKSAIKAAMTSPFDVILLDLVLPDISGNEVCRWLKLNTETKGIPIIMVSVKGELIDKVAGIEAGADDYISKPYNEIELNARIYASLRTKALQDELRAKNRQLEELLEKVRQMAVTDPLTGLFNRRHFQSILEKEFAKVLRYNTPLSLLMLDIDHFKDINDGYGHQVGDGVLKELADLMASATRKDLDTVARWGGEEFAVLLPHTDIEQARQAAARILRMVSGFGFSGLPSDRTVTVSIGVSTAPAASVDSADRLVKFSDNALYRAKEFGRNRAEAA